jgi:metal-dependent hydrolase (beta-lactamase superfamily II)
MPRFEMRECIGTVKELENVNINREDITDVIITHSHHNHIECVKYFENAVIHIQKDEYTIGKNIYRKTLM